MSAVDNVFQPMKFAMNVLPGTMLAGVVAMAATLSRSNLPEREREMVEVVRASGVTLDRFCGSGITAVNLAAAQIMSGMEDLVIAGGTEMMSLTASMAAEDMAAGKPPLGMGSGNAELDAIHPQSHQGVCGDAIAAMEGITREALDALALRLRPYLSDAQWDDLCASRRPPDRYVRISLAGARSPSLALNYLADREPRYPPPGASQPDYRLRGTLGDVEMLLPHDWVDAAEWRLEGV